MNRKIVCFLLAFTMLAAMISGCSSAKTATSSASSAETSSVASSAAASSQPAASASSAAASSAKTSSHVTNPNIEVTDKWAGDTLTIELSQGWADNRLDTIVDWFEEDYGVDVEVNFIGADDYTTQLQAKLTEGTASDIFWIQSDPFTIADYAQYAQDMSGAWWQSVMPETRQSACVYDGKLYGLQLWHNSPEYILVYNQTLLKELGYDKFPTTYSDLKQLCADCVKAGVSAPYFMSGSDGWYEQLAFFQIGGVYEEAQPGLYDGLNNNTQTFANNAKMLEVLNEFKELSDLGYFGKGWISGQYTDYETALIDRTSAFAMQNAGVADTLTAEASGDVFKLALNPLGDNDTYPTNAAGPTMFVNKASEHADLAAAFMAYCCDTACLQAMLDSWTELGYTNLDVTDDKVVQAWTDTEKEFVQSVPDEKKATSVLQIGTKYTNSAWGDFGNDMVAMCQGTETPEQVLEAMDGYRAELAKAANDPAWQ
jgi:raffinose/stachyose/melibiose transport system substrate-binding protein